jgi:hypothetical protein
LAAGNAVVGTVDVMVGDAGDSFEGQEYIIDIQIDCHFVGFEVCDEVEHCAED